VVLATVLASERERHGVVTSSARDFDLIHVTRMVPQQQTACQVRHYDIDEPQYTQIEHMIDDQVLIPPLPLFCGFNSRAHTREARDRTGWGFRTHGPRRLAFSGAFLSFVPMGIDFAANIFGSFLAVLLR
jgi:hypothetical protein